MAKRGPKPRKTAPAGQAWPGFEPPYLDPDAAREFARLGRRLEELGVAAKADPRIVVEAARVSSLLDAAHSAIAAEGLTVEAPNGVTQKHPMLSTVNSLTIRLKTLWAELGLTPRSAGLTDPKTSSGPDAWDGLLNVCG